MRNSIAIISASFEPVVPDAGGAPKPDACFEAAIEDRVFIRPVMGRAYVVSNKMVGRFHMHHVYNVK